MPPPEVVEGMEVVKVVEVLEVVEEGDSLTNRANGNATMMIRTPSACSAPCQPTARVSHTARNGTSAPPRPMPRYATPIARPRPPVNQRDSRTWFGNGPPHT